MANTHWARLVARARESPELSELSRHFLNHLSETAGMQRRTRAARQKPLLESSTLAHGHC